MWKGTGEHNQCFQYWKTNCSGFSSVRFKIIAIRSKYVSESPVETISYWFEQCISQISMIFGRDLRKYEKEIDIYGFYKEQAPWILDCQYRGWNRGCAKELWEVVCWNYSVCQLSSVAVAVNSKKRLHILCILQRKDWRTSKVCICFVYCLNFWEIGGF